ncbi:uncharacterized protein Z520_08418 [Fonsecaea multimorphosa CBS 102226]|uniref:6-methylsalicylate decarboxylase n=1 Tax=Fonsecaea multimorphosa CBS 102226 TaxID=1442371 RepID=A0A0D2IF25_9EURO|nr:uncharacterized protein Z520_08418 [Fonsecaea multimorphosa CBS 102226]KIX95711.1 hypothetical protein Z520_08418 [Fonsecaea multimorphosa CBS 102226]
MAQNLKDKLLGAVLHWPPTPPRNKVDTHHHFVPDFYAKGDPSGWPTPTWSSKSSLQLMDRLGTRTAILSVTAPGACIAASGPESADLARRLNLEGARIRDGNPARFGFFASLPDVLDTTAALKELRYALDDLGAHGVTLYTRYGRSNTYLGNPAIEPIWAELNRRKCVVFIHPTHPVDTSPVNKRMPQPMIDYPHETSRTAMDMIMMGTLNKYRDCKVILSHAGGTLPYVISRIATPLSKTPDLAAKAAIGVTHDTVMDNFRSFYFDLALSSSPAVLNMLLELVPHGHILYGSDFPYAPLPAYPAFLEQLETFQMDRELREKINFRNAQTLFPGLGRSSI